MQPVAPRPVDDDFLEELLLLIEERKVIPVIGQRAVTTAPNDELLYPWLARQLANKLGPSNTNSKAECSLSDVVTSWLVDKGEATRTSVYLKLHKILRDSVLAPGLTLKTLAGIPAFDLFITTSVDYLLERAINDVRFSGRKLTGVYSFSRQDLRRDLPVRKADLSVPAVYHLLGRASANLDFAACEEDVLEYVCALHDNLSVMERLARDLKEYGLLLLGLNFSDWLVRFFLRIATQSPLWERQMMAYLAEGPQGVQESMVLFFGGLRSKIQVVACEPQVFVAKLSSRWQHEFPDPVQARERFSPPPQLSMPKKAVFLSYAREDEKAVVRLKSALEDAGCIVWYDRERLKPGQYWAERLQEEISHYCSVFVSVISHNTESQEEAYFHRERRWAADRSSSFPLGEFYIPVVIDESALKFIREPKVARDSQATKAPGGNPPPDFPPAIRALQERRM